jgi:cytochrome c-type biogenesis protein CcmF
MELGTVLLYLGLIAGAAAVVASGLNLLLRREDLRRVGRLLGLAFAAILTLTFVLLAAYFLTANLSIAYVHNYTRTDYSLYYRWAGVLAGANGTILFWAWITALTFGVQELFWWRRERGEEGEAETGSATLKDWVRFIVLLFVLALFALVVRLDIFGPTSPMALVNYPNGYGLHANLLTPLMIAHPPLEFAGYMLTTVPMAGALAFFARGTSGWSSATLHWTRWAWLFYTLGIGVGGLWAYIVLGWGGYWAWDPIETVNLIPWLTLTALVHAQMRNASTRQYRHLAPILAVVTFVLSVFATFVTRSGLWVSVHDFAEVNVKEPGERLVRILETSVGPAAFFTMILVVLFVTALLVALRILWAEWRRKRGGGVPLVAASYAGLTAFLLVYSTVASAAFVQTAIRLSDFAGGGNAFLGLLVLVGAFAAYPVGWFLIRMEEPEEEMRWSLGSVVNNRALMSASLAVLVLGTVVTTALLLLSVNGTNRDAYDARAPLVVIPLVLVLLTCAVWMYVGRSNALALVGAAVFAGALGVLLYPASWVVGFGVPLLIVALATVFYKILKVADGGRRVPMEARVAGGALMASGILAMVMWGAPPSTVSVVYFSFRPDLVVAVLGFIAGAAAMVSGVVTMKGGSPVWGVIGAVLGAVALGYLVGTALAFVALAALGASAARGTAKSVRPTLKVLNPTLRFVGSHLIHLSIVLFILGYVTSTYMVQETTDDPVLQEKFLSLGMGDTATFDGYDFRLAGSEAYNEDGVPGYERMVAHIEVSEGGRLLTVASPYMKWAGHMGHYHQFAYVENVVVKDLYFIVRGFFTPDDGWLLSMGAGESQGVKFLSSSLTSVALEIRSIPGMTAVWGGFWTMSAGIVFVAVSGHMHPFKRRVRAPRPAVPTGYEARLERELSAEAGT